MQTKVVGCKLSTMDLCFVRIELPFSIAFNSTEEVILYTQIFSPEVDLKKEEKKFKPLGPLKKNFGVHELRGGPFEVVISREKKVIPSITMRANSDFSLDSPLEDP